MSSELPGTLEVADRLGGSLLVVRCLKIAKSTLEGENVALRLILALRSPAEDTEGTLLRVVKLLPGDDNDMAARSFCRVIEAACRGEI